MAPSVHVFYRLWAGPSDELPLEEFDNLPHHKLARRHIAVLLLQSHRLTDPKPGL